MWDLQHIASLDPESLLLLTHTHLLMGFRKACANYSRIRARHLAFFLLCIIWNQVPRRLWIARLLLLSFLGFFVVGPGVLNRTTGSGTLIQVGLRFADAGRRGASLRRALRPWRSLAWQRGLRYAIGVEWWQLKVPSHCNCCLLLYCQGTMSFFKSIRRSLSDLRRSPSLI